MQSYWPAIFVSLLGHASVIVFALWGWSAPENKVVSKKPDNIQATLVKLEEKAKPVVKKTTPKPKPKPKPKVDKAKKALEEKKRLEKKLAEKKRIEKEKAEIERNNQLAKKKAEEMAKKAAEEKKKEQERLRKEELLKELKLERQRELEREVAAEKARLAAEQQAANDEELAQSYNHIIDERVTANWSRPPSARNNMVTLLRIQLVPTGEVIAVNVIQSSGNTAFDRSAIRAVKKAARFPELQELPSRVFEKHFRIFNLLFEPKDLRQ